MLENKKIVIIVVLSICILIVTLLVVNKDKEEFSEDKTELQENIDYENENIYKIQKINSITDYYNMKVCIEKFYLYYSRMYGGDKDDALMQENIDYSNIFYSMLSPQYTEKHGISQENVKTKFDEKKDFKIRIDESYYVTNFSQLKIFIAKGILQDNNSKTKEDFEIMVVLDSDNFTFEVYLGDYLNNGDFLVGGKFDFDFEETIQNRTYNIFNNVKISFDEYAKNLFDDAISLMLNDSERAYSLLDEEFKKSNYPTQEQFNQYIANNSQKLYLMSYGDYSTSMNENEMIDYICYDEDSKYCITFYLTATMEYKFKFEEL